MNNVVVIMAGGKGERLDPITKVLPKPLIPIGDTPIVERIMNRFLEFGYNKFYLTINYKKNLIKSYFNDLNKGYDINYIEEIKPLGTAGSLYLLKNTIKSTFFLSNCDILISADYSQILKYHQESKNLITVVVAKKLYMLPYGIINIDKNDNVEELLEKPQSTYLVNTGMYVLEPEVFDDIPENQFYHITDLIKKYICTKNKVGVFQIEESAWLDMGQFNEMRTMINILN